VKDRLITFLDPHRSVPLYLLGSVELALIAQFIIDWAKEPGKWQGNHTVMVYGLVVVLLAMGVIWIQSRPKQVYLLEEQKPRKKSGLLLLVSEHKAAAPGTISYHQEQLKHCWLIATGRSAAVAVEIAEDFADQEIEFRHGTPYQVLHDDYTSTYRLVRDILTKEVPAAGLVAADVIADITGGTKPMTAGMVKACIDYQLSMQYMVAEKDEQGRAKPGAVGIPIRLDTPLVRPQEK
jgi:hypothetical protein